MIGKILMTLATLAYGIIPVIMDVSDTHVFHPDWTGHARFHNVWLLGISTAFGLWSLWLLWGSRREQEEAIQLTGVFGVIVLGAFFLAVFTSPFYGGTMADPDGVKEVAEGIYANVIVFSAALLTLLSGWFLSRKKIQADQ